MCEVKCSVETGMLLPNHTMKFSEDSIWKYDSKKQFFYQGAKRQKIGEKTSNVDTNGKFGRIYSVLVCAFGKLYDIEIDTANRSLPMHKYGHKHLKLELVHNYWTCMNNLTSIWLSDS